MCHGLNLQKAKLGGRTDPFYGETQSSQRLRDGGGSSKEIKQMQVIHSVPKSGYTHREAGMRLVLTPWASSVCFVSMKWLREHSCSLRLEEEGEGSTSSHVLSAPCVPVQCCAHKHDFTMLAVSF